MAGKRVTMPTPDDFIFQIRGQPQQPASLMTFGRASRPTPTERLGASIGFMLDLDSHDRQVTTVWVTVPCKAGNSTWALHPDQRIVSPLSAPPRRDRVSGRSLSLPYDLTAIRSHAEWRLEAEAVAAPAPWMTRMCIEFGMDGEWPWDAMTLEINVEATDVREGMDLAVEMALVEFQRDLP